MQPITIPVDVVIAQANVSDLRPNAPTMPEFWVVK